MESTYTLLGNINDAKIIVCYSMVTTFISTFELLADLTDMLPFDPVPSFMVRLVAVLI